MYVSFHDAHTGLLSRKVGCSRLDVPAEISETAANARQGLSTEHKISFENAVSLHPVALN
jgi:hypothetical protein